MGANDMVISNDGSRLQAELFTNPTVVVDPEAGHFAPLPENPTYNQVLDFFANNPANSGSATSTIAEISTSTDSPTTEESTTTTPVIESTENVADKTEFSPTSFPVSSEPTGLPTENPTTSRPTFSPSERPTSSPNGTVIQFAIPTSKNDVDVNAIAT
eukprot:UN11969